MPSSSLQFVNAQTQPHLPTARLLTPLPQGQAPDRCALSQQRPGGTRHLVGKRHRDYLEWFAVEKLGESVSAPQAEWWRRLLASTSRSRHLVGHCAIGSTSNSPCACPLCRDELWHPGSFNWMVTGVIPVWCEWIAHRSLILWLVS